MSRHWDFRKELLRPGRDRRRPRRRVAGRFGRGELQLVLVVGVTLGLASQLGELQPADRANPGSGAAVGLIPTTGPVRIIDGDTFDQGGQRIRIADIDTPELNGACAAEIRLAQAARTRLGALLAQGPFELRRLGRDEDRYGRKLRIVIRDGRSVGDRLVAEGLARTWTGQREPWC